MKFTIKNDELLKEAIGKTPEFPKYTTQLMNLANQNAQGTRPKIVGQMSDLIAEYRGRDHNGWEKFYVGRNPNALEEAAEKVYMMVKELEAAISKIDKDMVEAWVKDLVVNKTFIGFRFQEAVLKKIAA